MRAESAQAVISRAGRMAKAVRQIRSAGTASEPDQACRSSAGKELCRICHDHSSQVFFSHASVKELRSIFLKSSDRIRI